MHLRYPIYRVWQSTCEEEGGGNCIIYNNEEFRISYHAGNAAFQFLAILAIVACYIAARRFTFPEEELPQRSENSYEQIDTDNFDDRPQKVSQRLVVEVPPPAKEDIFRRISDTSVSMNRASVQRHSRMCKPTDL